jgi:hypothetical protein
MVESTHLPTYEKDGTPVSSEDWICQPWHVTLQIRSLVATRSSNEVVVVMPPLPLTSRNQTCINVSILSSASARALVLSFLGLAAVLPV